MRRTLAAALLLACVLAFPATTAFVSVPPGSSAHDTITADAATPLGFQDLSLKALQEAERRPDLLEVKVSGGGPKLVVLDAGADYEASHHCDRNPPTPDAKAFRQTSLFVQLEREEALDMARSHHPERAIYALGYALHALQDCHSHSSIGEKDEATQRAYDDALLHGGPMPPGVQLCGFQPGAKNAEMPEGDRYPHGLFNKDQENSTIDAAQLLPNGQTKFAAARALAVTASHTFLREFMANLTDVERAELFTATPTTSPHHLPGMEPWVAVVLVGAVAVARRLHGPRTP